MKMEWSRGTLVSTIENVLNTQIWVQEEGIMKSV